MNKVKRIFSISRMMRRTSLPRTSSLQRFNPSRKSLSTILTLRILNIKMTFMQCMRSLWALLLRTTRNYKFNRSSLSKSRSKRRRKRRRLPRELLGAVSRWSLTLRMTLVEMPTPLLCQVAKNQIILNQNLVTCLKLLKLVQGSSQI